MQASTSRIQKSWNVYVHALRCLCGSCCNAVCHAMSRLCFLYQNTITTCSTKRKMKKKEARPFHGKSKPKKCGWKSSLCLQQSLLAEAPGEKAWIFDRPAAPTTRLHVSGFFCHCPARLCACHMHSSCVLFTDSWVDRPISAMLGLHYAQSADRTVACITQYLNRPSQLQ